jgi:hypothetical protein
MKIQGKIWAFILLSSLSIEYGYGQNKKNDKREKKVAEIKNKVANQQYTFVADYMIPQSGPSKSLNSGDYDFSVKKDSLVAYLPYYGRAYFDIPYNATDGGIKFTSTKFDYRLTARKNGSWLVQIIPQDVKNTSKIFMDISKNGYATLSINSNNKDEITFNGYLQ